MGFHEVQFPTNISYGSQGGPGYKTAIVESDAGDEQRISRWQDARREYDVRYGIRSRSDISTVLNFYMAREGAANGFRFKDWNDFSSATDHIGTPTSTDCPIGTFTAGGSRTWQLQKRYVSGGTTKYRAITKPVVGTIVVAINGVTTTAFTSDSTNGQVTLNSDPADGALITAGCYFDVPVRFDESADRLMAISIDSFDERSLPSCRLVEIKDATPTDPIGLFTVGACESVIASNTILNLGRGGVQYIQASSGGLQVRLPNPANMPTGGPLFTIFAAGANNFDITDHLGTTTFISGFAPGAVCEASVTIDGSGNKHWLVY
jgi:uncharacterized protein (TIGR02217 family)